MNEKIGLFDIELIEIEELERKVAPDSGSVPIVE